MGNDHAAAPEGSTKPHLPLPSVWALSSLKPSTTTHDLSDSQLINSSFHTSPATSSLTHPNPSKHQPTLSNNTPFFSPSKEPNIPLGRREPPPASFRGGLFPERAHSFGKPTPSVLTQKNQYPQPISDPSLQALQDNGSDIVSRTLADRFPADISHTESSATTPDHHHELLLSDGTLFSPKNFLKGDISKNLLNPQEGPQKSFEQTAVLGTFPALLHRLHKEDHPEAIFHLVQVALRQDNPDYELVVFYLNQLTPPQKEELFSRDRFSLLLSLHSICPIQLLKTLYEGLPISVLHIVRRFLKPDLIEVNTRTNLLIQPQTQHSSQPRSPIAPPLGPPPASPASSPREQPDKEKPTTPDSKSPRIVLIGVDPTITAFLPSQAHTHGYQIQIEYDSLQALQLIHTKKPDLLILDETALGDHGLDLCRTLKRTPELQDLPIIILASEAGERDVILSMVLGADAYLEKPFSPHQLFALIEKLLHQSAV
jgi:CheY-like chemotaxis protein